MTKVSAEIALHRFYLYGRDDAEEDFDPDDYDLEALYDQELSKVLFGEDMRRILAQRVDTVMAAGAITGDEAEWRDSYADELAGVDEKQARRYWAQGFRDEAVMELEDELVDMLRAKFKLEGAHDDEVDATPGSYAAYGTDGTNDAIDTWDDAEMGEYVDQAVEQVKRSGWATAEERAGAIKNASKVQAERYQADMEEDGAKDHWMDHNEETASDDGLNPEVAYDQYWRPAFVAKMAVLIGDAVDGEIARENPKRAGRRR